MTRNELIAQVSLDLVRQQLGEDPEGTLRFCMVGLDAGLVLSIARAVLADPDVGSVVNVRVPSAFAAADTLPSEAISDESITHWRHCRLEEGKRGVLFAATHEELQRNDKSLEKITRIETDRLRDLYTFWIERAGLTAQHIDAREREHLHACLAAANDTHAARTIERFADFVLSIADGVVSRGLPIQKAIDDALPALQLPRNAGDFDRLPEKTRGKQSEWAKIFRRLHSRVRPFLVRENDRGESIVDQLQKNFADIKDHLSENQIHVIEAFLKADLTPEVWSSAQADLAALDWRSITGLFEGTERTRTLPLGPRTIKFFEEEFDDQLDDDQDLLTGSLPKIPTEPLEDFFELRREQLAHDKKLYGQWERYIYRNPQPFEDFFVGLIDTLHRLRERTDDSDLQERRLVVRIPRGREKSFWRGKNVHVARYFCIPLSGPQQAVPARGRV